MNQTWTIGSNLSWTTDYLERHGDANARLSTQWIIGKATGLSRIELYMDIERPLTKEELACIRDGIERRCAGEPLQYICGMAPFRYLDIKVKPGVLIPRPETELLVDACLKYLEKCTEESLLVADVGCGSGCITCALVTEDKRTNVIALDISDEALSITKENVEALKITDRVEVRKSDLFAAVADKQNVFDVIVSNPPYIPNAVMNTLPDEVKNYEPDIALRGGDDGLDIYRKIIVHAFPLLKTGGLLACELHEDCLELAEIIAKENGYREVAIHKDLAGKNRFITMIK